MLHDHGFPIGRARLACVDFVPSPVLAQAAGFPLRLITGRVLAHYNCGTMTRRSDNLALAPHDVIELHPADADAAEITDGERIDVVSPFGRARAVAQRSDRMAPGEAFLSFHFPETGTNQLMSRVLDRVADCPEYKITPIRIEKLPSRVG